MKIWLLTLVCDVCCDFVTFPFGIIGHACYLTVSIPDPCCLSYLFETILHLILRVIWLDVLRYEPCSVCSVMAKFTGS